LFAPEPAEQLVLDQQREIVAAVEAKVHPSKTDVVFVADTLLLLAR
jgi:hypothetical protein